MTALWHPHAQRITIPGAVTGPFVAAPPRLVMHTTEGRTAASAIQTWRRNHDIPTFLISPTELFQFVSLAEYARALQHVGSVETNRMHAIQIEQVGFAGEAGGWSHSYYRRIHELAVWIHHQNGVQLDWDGVSFRHPERMTHAQWKAFDGVCGHVHVPDQPDQHTDPGRGYHVGYACNGVS